MSTIIEQMVNTYADKSPMDKRNVVNTMPPLN
jgi:hypothetical protein